MLCPSCGTQNPEAADFCTNCRRALVGPGEAAEPTLVWQTDDGARHTISLTRTVTIGRSAANDITIQDSAISRQHSRIEAFGSEISAVDLGSLNGTFVNDQRVEDPQALHDGDLLRVGRIVFTAVIPEPAEMQEARTVALQDEPTGFRLDAVEDEGSAAPTMFVASDEEEADVVHEAGVGQEAASVQDEWTFLPAGEAAEEAELVAAEAESQPYGSQGDGQQPYLTEAEAHPEQFAEPAFVEEPADPALLTMRRESIVAEEPEAPAFVQAAPPADEDERTFLPSGLGADQQLIEPALPPVEEPTPAGYLVFGETRIPLYSSLSVGRAEGVDIRIDDDRTVSRNHARLEVRSDGVWIVDNSSANGTFLESERVTEPIRIAGDATIRFGNTAFRFETIQEASPPAAAEAVAPAAEVISDDTLVGAPAGLTTQPVRVAQPEYDSGATIAAVGTEDHTLRGDSPDLEPVPVGAAPMGTEGGDASPDQYRLIVNFGADAGNTYPLIKDVTVIGRASPEADYDIQLNDRAVSRPHAKIMRTGDGYGIQDLESANGTWLNYTEEISALRTLSDGDIIKMGKTTLVYRVPAAIRPAPPEVVLDPNIGQILTTFSLKGGVGTTTLAVNLAVLLRRLTVQPVLLIDLATEQGTVSVHMNLAQRVTLADLPSDPAVIDADVVLSLVTHHASGVDVLPAPPSPQSAELVSPTAVSSILPILRTKYRWIVVDTGATFSELNLGVLDQSDLLMLVFAPDLSSLKVVQSTLDVLSALQTPAEKRVLVLNQVYPKPHLLPSEIEHTLGERIGLTLPYAEEVLLDTIDKGIPLALDQANHPTVAAIESFASRLAQLNVEAAQQPKRGGFGRWVQGIVSGLRR
jgi:pSer/pThr/pTyr-binding forkhead associated (FHA) protein